MSIEIEKTDLTIETIGGERSTQIIVDGDIIVPDTKPDIEKILNVTSTINILEEKISDNRAFFKGEIIYSIIYIGKSENHCIYSMISSIPFEDIISLPETNKNTTTNLSFVTENINYKIINDRKINIRCAITAKAETIFSENINMIKNIFNNNNIMIKEKILKMFKCNERKKDLINISEILTLPSGKPNIGNIVDCSGYISNREFKTSNGKINIKGNLCISIIYISDTEENMAETAFFEIPFNINEECKNCSENMIINSNMDISNINFKTELDEDGEERKINIDVPIKIYICVYENTDIEIADDIYSLTENIIPQKKYIDYPYFLMKNSTKSKFKENIIAEDKYPEMLRVQNVYSKIDITDKKILDNKIIAEGVISGNILYTAQSDIEPICVIPYNIPFSQEIETNSPKIDNNIYYNINGYIDDISFNMLSERETEIKITCIFDVTAFKNINTNIIIDVTTDTNDTNTETAGIIIYTIQKNDTLWDIAKKYHTTIDNITLINDIENIDKLKCGEKILILKKINSYNIINT